MLLIIASLLVFLISRKLKYIINLLILSYIAIPNNPYILNVLHINVNLMDIEIDSRILLSTLLIMYYLLSSLYKKETVLFYKKDIPFLLLFLVVLIYTFIGFYYKQPYVKAEFIIFYNFIISYFLFRIHITNNETVTKTIKITSIGCFLYALYCIYLFIFGEHLLPLIYGENLYKWWGNRIAFSNTSILLLSTFFTAYFFYEGYYKKYNFFSLIVQIFAILISQNRTLIILLIINIVILQFFVLLKIIRSRVSSKFIILNSISLIVLIILLFLLFNDHQIYKIGLISEIFSRFFEDKNYSVDVRKITNTYALEQINRNPIGYGIGKEMILFNLDYSINTVGLFIDNVFLTIFTKMGVFGVIIFFLLIANFMIYSLNIFIKTKNQIYFLLTLIYPGFFLMSGIMNAQIIYSKSVATFFAILYAIIIRNSIDLKLKN